MPALIGSSSPAPSSAPASSTRAELRTADRRDNVNRNDYDCADTPDPSTPTTVYEDGEPPTRERIVALLAQLDVPAEFVHQAVEFANRPHAERMLILFVQLFELRQSVKETLALVQAQNDERDE
ncbi:hypothetical protein HDU87_000288 [Geranomyces variabilis]|uniref:Uncharacterized protein n=1 Tax=Geranomyces variabilis TaxID=109894 RepID=A0AAD5TSG8_9FUNG|nr:hypothetical protein HDU87_000288 [Geranomyces variabilis]